MNGTAAPASPALDHLNKRHDELSEELSRMGAQLENYYVSVTMGGAHSMKYRDYQDLILRYHSALIMQACIKVQMFEQAVKDAFKNNMKV